MTINKKLTVLGSINVDHIIQVPHFPQPGETISGENYHTVFGGKGANQAVAAARSGADVTFIACIGDDDIGQKMKNSFKEQGINVETITTIPQKSTGIAMIQIDNNGENSIVISPGANSHLTIETVEKFKQKIIDSDALLMQLETPLEAIIHATKIASQSGKYTILNPAPAKLLPDELFSHLTMITPNETETEVLTGIKVIDEQTAIQAATIFHKKGVKIVLITLGKKGVFISHNQSKKTIPCFRVNAKDTTAAGDTFNGALITALLENKSLEQAIIFAHAAAAISVTQIGAQSSIPTRKEILDFLQSVK